MKKIQNDRHEYIDCPTCRGKHYVPINSIPKSLVIIQLITTKRQSLRNQYPDDNQHFGVTQNIINENRDLPPPYSTSSVTRQSQSDYQISSNDYYLSHGSNNNPRM